jgi:aspartyl-tRNA(Asn)/glutamyl-tRNA(Gln) amidotransferase subunit B
MRADVNVSVRRPGEDYGTRTETKNVNSVRFVEQAIDYEAARQVEVLEDGGTIDQETRLFDPNRGETRPMRSKEEAHDYRYFPDPDLLPLVLDKDWVEEIKRSLPELPDKRKVRLMDRYGLSSYQAAILVSDKNTADAFEEEMETYFTKKLDSSQFKKVELYVRTIDPVDITEDMKLLVESSASSTANTVISTVFAVANERNEPPEDWIRKLDLAGLQILLDDEVISSTMGKTVISEMVKTGKNAAEIVEEKGLKQITDTGAIEAIVDKIIADNPDQAEQARANPKAIGWFVGQVMQQTQGQANPKSVNELLRKKLSG